MTPKAALEKIIERAGSKSALARHCKVVPPAVEYWVNTRVPAARAVQLEQISGGEVTRHDLRPDLFGPKPKKAVRQ